MSRRKVSTVIVALVLTALAPLPFSFAAEEQPPPAAAGITLITGDRVGIGPRDTLSVTPGPDRADVTFFRRTIEGHQYVLPADALPLLRSGRVDQRLFDITALREFGYTTELPLLVQGARATGSGVLVTRDLPALDSVALSVGAAERARMWRTWTGDRSKPATLQSGVERILLDGKRRITADTSVAAIGAPAAWQAGLDGTGVTVAVLDTGIDATHPDLAGRIAESADFTPAKTTDDTVGHGTHVASIIAGTGAKYRGVAPGAKLVVGKVCEAELCTESSILAGMIWAAPRAPVVNMSLGGLDMPGIDILEQAVTDLTAEHRTLFVVAAGNTGGPGFLNTPGTSDAALTVGAVDDKGRPASFSSRGPRRGDGGLKPDITAPGVGIIAAAAAHGTIGAQAGAGYVALSGTSMAAPHVAGAAAILTGQHPDWTPQQRKTALMGSARPTPGVDVYVQGAGQVDVARAIGQTVGADQGSLNFGKQLWPHDDDTPTGKDLTYRNTGTAPATLSLTVSGAADQIALSARELTVPAGGTAAVTVTADTRRPGADGFRTGRVVATGPGDVRIETPVAVQREPESYEFTFRHLGTDGQPTGTYQTSLHGADPSVTLDLPGGEPSGTLRLPVGTYGLHSFITGTDGVTTLLVQPALEVKGKETLDVDARAGRPIRVTVPDADARPVQAAVSAAWKTDRYFAAAGVIVGRLDQVQAGQLGGAGTTTGFAASINATFARATGGSFHNSPVTYDLAYGRTGSFFTGFTKDAERAELGAVQAEYVAEADGITGVKANYADLGSPVPAWSTQTSFDLPFQRTEYLNTDGPVGWSGQFSQLQAAADPQSAPESVSSLSSSPIRVAANSTQEQKWNRAPFVPSVAASADAVERTGDTITAAVPMFADGTGHAGWSVSDTARTRLYSGGELIGERDQDGAQFVVPAADAPYELRVTANRGEPHRLSTTVSGVWAFRSSATRQGPLPISTVRLRPTLNDDNAAPAGTVFDIPFTVQRAPGTPAGSVAAVTADISYDDGRTWAAAAVTGSGDARTARVTHPAGPGFASLRVRTEDSAGSTATITVIRAYEITAG